MNNKGISILEVLVAMVVLTIGLLGVAPMVVLSIKGNSISRDTTVTAKLAKEKIEYFESLDAMPVLPYTSSESTDDGIYDIKVAINDSSTDANVPSGVSEIKVVISWLDDLQQPKLATYSTYLRKGVIHDYF